MVRLHAEKNWERLNAEQLNASRTVQVRWGNWLFEGSVVVSTRIALFRDLNIFPTATQRPLADSG